MPDQAPPNIASYIVPIVFVGVVVLLRMRRASRTVPLNLWLLWLIPALYVGLTAAILAFRPPGPSALGPLLGALALGALVGWYRGKTVRITHDAATNRLMQQASPLAMLILVALILLRQALGREAAALGLNVHLMTQVLIVFAAAMFLTGAIERYLRARKLLLAAD